MQPTDDNGRKNTDVNTSIDSLTNTCTHVFQVVQLARWTVGTTNEMVLLAQHLLPHSHNNTFLLNFLIDF